MDELTPRQIVEELDKYIIGQNEAKKSVAIALRNRYRRMQITSELKDEVIPKNILMIGPTGVGKTEIARRLARMAKAPFLKVEVSKFTEVGYVGRDVESMVRDLLETGIRMVKEEKMAEVQERAQILAEERLLDILLPGTRTASNTSQGVELGSIFDQQQQEQREERERREIQESRDKISAEDSAESSSLPQEQEDEDSVTKRQKRRRERFRQRLRDGFFDDKMVEIEVEASNQRMLEIFSSSGMEEMGVNMEDLFGNLLPSKKKKRKVTVEKAREILQEKEAARLIDMDEVSSEAIDRVEQEGIIFLDEIDKIAGRESDSGPEVSREGVQRDILPIVEGSTIMTKHGSVATDHILFIAAGAFHVSSPADLIPELQGRFPIRVELDSLTRQDFTKILQQPENALTKQYQALLATENLTIEFTESGIDAIASYAARINDETENIGARRLHTIMEKVLEEISFSAPEMEENKVVIDEKYVDEALAEIVKDRDLSRYIL